MFTIYLWIVGTLICFDFVRWCTKEDTVFHTKPSFFEWMIASLIGNVLFGLVLLVVVQIISWIFN